MKKIILLLVGLVIIAAIAAVPVAPKVNDFIQSRLAGTREDSMNKIELNNEDTTVNINQATPSASASPSPVPTGDSVIVKEDKIDKQDGNVHYEGSVKSATSESHTDITENGTRTVTNSNTLNSSTNINVHSDTGGNEGKNVTNGDNKVSIRVKTNGDGTSIDYP